MSKLTNDREILCFLTAVLAEPRQQFLPSRPEFLEFFSLQNPVRKVESIFNVFDSLRANLKLFMGYVERFEVNVEHFWY
jgi:hypothetical protein